MKKVLCPVCWHEETWRAIRQHGEPVHDDASTMLWHRPEGGARGQIVNEHPEIELTQLDQHLPVLFPIITRWLGRILERLLGIEEAYVKAHLDLADATAIVSSVIV